MFTELLRKTSEESQKIFKTYLSNFGYRLSMLDLQLSKFIIFQRSYYVRYNL